MPPSILRHFHKKWGHLRTRLSENEQQVEVEALEGQGMPIKQDRRGDVTKMAIPLELYRPIIEHVESGKDLYNLLFVTWFFRLEAERVLYCTVEFGNHSLDRLNSFLEQIALCGRVALHVQDLAINDVRTGSFDLIKKALQGMSKLKKLTLKSPTFIRSLSSFYECGFQLRTLVMRGILTDDSAFLGAQKELIELDMADYCELALPPEALPKLLILTASFPGLHLITNRALGALRFIQSPPARIRSERMDSVRSLRLPYPYSWSPEDFSSILEAFPSLRYLHVGFGFFLPENVWVNFVETLFKLLSHLVSLEKFHLFHHYSYRLSPVKQSAVLDNGFGFLKNVEVIAIDYISSRHRMEWVRGAKDCEHFPSNDDEWKDPRWSLPPNPATKRLAGPGEQ